MVITMFHPIAMLALDMTFLACDYSYKRIKGTINEWRVAGMSHKYQQRTSLSLCCTVLALTLQRRSYRYNLL
jgi:hypothetical protein